MPTISDVAARAGVGAATVSRVLNDSPKVRATTRARVLEAIDALGYRPSRLARGLSRGRSQTVGVIVAFFTHPSAVERLRGVVAGLQGSSYDLVLLDVEAAAHRDEHLTSLDRQRVDGLLVMSLPLRPEELERLQALEVGLVLVDTHARGVASVLIDDVAGGRLAAQHLLDLGHRRIAFVGESPDNDLGFTSSARRERGVRDTLAAAGLALPEHRVLYAPHHRDAAASVVAGCLTRRDRPTAVFACSDVQALGVIEAARRTGLRVPEDLSVVGFDDIELSTYAGITTVRQPLFESGRLGVELLLRALAGDDPGAPLVHELPLELVHRSTTAPPGRRGRRAPAANRRSGTSASVRAATGAAESRSP